MNFFEINKRYFLFASLVFVVISAVFLARIHFQKEAEKKFVEFVKPSTVALSKSIDVFCDIVEGNNQDVIGVLRLHKSVIEQNYDLLKDVDDGLYAVKSRQYIKLCRDLVSAQIDYATALVKINAFANSAMSEGNSVMRDGRNGQKVAFLAAFCLKSQFELKDSIAERDSSAVKLHEEADRLIALIKSVDRIDNRHALVNEENVKKVYRN